MQLVTGSLVDFTAHADRTACSSDAHRTLNLIHTSEVGNGPRRTAGKAQALKDRVDDFLSKCVTPFVCMIFTPLKLVVRRVDHLADELVQRLIAD